MAPKKGKGKSKGKQPAPKAPPKRPPPEVSSEEEVETVDWSAIMNKLSELERARGLAPPAKVTTPRGRTVQRTSTHKAKQAELLQRLSVLEGVEAGTPGEDAAGGNEASGAGAGDRHGPDLGSSGVLGRINIKGAPTQPSLGWPWDSLGQATASGATLSSFRARSIQHTINT